MEMDFYAYFFPAWFSRYSLWLDWSGLARSGPLIRVSSASFGDRISIGFYLFVSFASWPFHPVFDCDTLPLFSL